jgi:hypothetical protein
METKVLMCPCVIVKNEDEKKQLLEKWDSFKGKGFAFINYDYPCLVGLDSQVFQQQEVELPQDCENEDGTTYRFFYKTLEGALADNVVNFSNLDSEFQALLISNIADNLSVGKRYFQKLYRVVKMVDPEIEINYKELTMKLTKSSSSAVAVAVKQYL